MARISPLKDYTDQEIRNLADERFGAENFNERRSNGKELRYGSKGAIKVNLTKPWRGYYKDFEDKKQKGWLTPKQQDEAEPTSTEETANKDKDTSEKEKQAEEELQRQQEIADKRAHAQAQWAMAKPVIDTPAEIYLRRERKLQLPTNYLDAMRWHEAHQLTPDSPSYAALLVPFRTHNDDIVGIGAVRIDPKSGKKMDLGGHPSKPAHHIGSLIDAPVYIQLGDRGSTTLSLAEGLETGLTRLAVAPCLLYVCWGSVRYVAPPSHIRRVEIVADRDKVQEARKVAREYAQKHALQAYVIVPGTETGPKGDLNDVLQLAVNSAEAQENMQRLLTEAEHIQDVAGSKETKSIRLQVGSQVEVGQRVLERIEDLYGPIVHDDASLWYFDGRQYSRLEGTQLERLVHGLDGAIYPTADGKVSILRISHSYANGVAAVIRTYRDSQTFFTANQDDRPPIIPTSNRILELDPDTGDIKVANHYRGYRNRHVLPGRYLEEHVALLQKVEDGDEDVIARFKSTLLGKLLYGSFQGDSDLNEKIKLIQEVLGVIASGWGTRITDPRAVVAYGFSAENGKSQITKLMLAMAPASATCSVSPSNFSDEKYMYELGGKIVNAIDELPEAAISSDRFKAVITGDSVPARDVYKSAGKVTPVALHWYTTNALPRFSKGIDNGVMRRLLFVRFNRTIPKDERIRQLGARIASEEADLLVAFAALGLSRFLREGDYTVSESCEAVMEQFLIEGDPVRGWMDERATYKQSSNARTTSPDAYRDFTAWCGHQGIKGQFIPNRTSFGRRLANALPGLPPENKRKSNGVTFYPGLELKDVPNEDPGEEDHFE